MQTIFLADLRYFFIFFSTAAVAKVVPGELAIIDDISSDKSGENDVILVRYYG